MAQCMLIKIEQSVDKVCIEKKSAFSLLPSCKNVTKWQNSFENLNAEHEMTVWKCEFEYKIYSVSKDTA